MNIINYYDHPCHHYKVKTLGYEYDCCRSQAAYVHYKKSEDRIVIIQVLEHKNTSSKMVKNVLIGICCCAGFNLLIHTACAILQWILFASERADEVACLNDAVLAAAILSSLATLLKAITALYISACLGVMDIKTGFAIKFGTMIVLQVLQLLLKLAALVCTLSFTISHSKPDPCGTKADPGNHTELPPLIIAVVSLESISSFIESIMKLFEICYKRQQRKKMGYYQTL